VATFETTASQLVREIRRRRSAMKMTQEDVAFASDISVRHYQLIESGQNSNPRLKTLFNIANALETSIQNLLDAKSPIRLRVKPKR
jgi:transcriptional regulator with XRE-family HTH domain